MIDPCAAPQSKQNNGLLYVKGQAVRVFNNQALNALSDVPVDCREANALTLEIQVSGTGASATVSIEGAPEAGGPYLPLFDPNASKTVTTRTSFDCIVGTAWAKVRIADIVGSYVNQGFSVIATPYVSPGQSNLSITFGT